MASFEDTLGLGRADRGAGTNGSRRNDSDWENSGRQERWVTSRREAQAGALQADHAALCAAGSVIQRLLTGQLTLETFLGCDRWRG